MSNHPDGQDLWYKHATFNYMSLYGEDRQNPISGLLYVNNGSVVTVSSVSIDGLTLGASTQTGNYTLTADDDIILANGTITITLPNVSVLTGKMYHIKNIGTGLVTIDGDGQTIDGDSSIYIFRQYDSVSIMCDGSNWYMI